MLWDWTRFCKWSPWKSLNHRVHSDWNFSYVRSCSGLQWSTLCGVSLRTAGHTTAAFPSSFTIIFASLGTLICVAEAVSLNIAVEWLRKTGWSWHGQVTGRRRGHRKGFVAGTGIVVTWGGGSGVGANGPPLFFLPKNSFLRYWDEERLIRIEIFYRRLFWWS